MILPIAPSLAKSDQLSGLGFYFENLVTGVDLIVLT